MGERTAYVPGTFSWVDLATSDVDAARSFYSALFGWTTEDDPGGTPYTICRLGDDAVCGLSALSDGAPRWTSYVSVEDADAAADRAVSLGGSVIVGTSDVEDYGRAAVLADPQRASFAVWQPGSRIGADRVNDVGCLCMNELATSDVTAARSFYEGLFGWTTEAVDTGSDGPEMVSVMNAGSLNATISAADDGESPQWRPYFTVESVESTVDTASGLGASIVFGPFPIPDGSIAIALDPQGAVFAMFEGETDP